MNATALPGFLLLVGLGFLVACAAETDRQHYAPGDRGQTEFANHLSVPVFLDGCSVYAFEKREQGTWTDRGPAVVCVWEGFARRVEPGTSQSFDLFAPTEPGLWRLRYPVGLRCEDGRPLTEDACLGIRPVFTDPFAVVELCEPRECGPQLGMPNFLCPDGESFAGPTGRCLRDAETKACGWEIASCPAD